MICIFKEHKSLFNKKKQPFFFLKNANHLKTNDSKMNEDLKKKNRAAKKWRQVMKMQIIV